MVLDSLRKKGDYEKALDVLKRVTLAVETLCVGKGDVRSRLESAVGDLIPLREQDFPDRLAPRFRQIIEQSTKYDATDRLKFGLPADALTPGHKWYEGRLHPTMRRIRRSTGSKIAQEIWWLYSELQRIAGKHRSNLAGDGFSDRPRAAKSGSA